VSEQERLTRAAVTAARSQGCVCEPNVRITGSGRLFNVTLKHGGWCPLYRSLQEHDGERRGPTGPIVVVPPGWGRGQ
jgi:hypothetical protein